MSRAIARSALLVLALAASSSSCVVGASRVRTLPMPSRNPTSWTFDLPVEQVRSGTIEAFSFQRQLREAPFPAGDLGAYRERVDGELEDLWVLKPGDSFFPESISSASGNEHDLYLHADGPLWLSPVYRGKDGGLPFEADFHLHLVPVGEGNTSVSVMAIDCRLSNGERFGLGPCGPGMFTRFEKVESTSVEEYRILRYLGRFLGATDMPEVVLPAPDRSPAPSP
jgi:hypothetical protein